MTPLALEALRNSLAAMPDNSKKRGLEYFKEGRVQEIKQDKRENLFTAIVNGSERYKTSLKFDPDEGWEGECSCPVDFGPCKHLFAFGKALLAEHSVAKVQNLSRPAKDTGANPQIEKADSNMSLREALRTKVGRELTHDESDFVTRVARAFERVKQERNYITPFDFELMGLSLRQNRERINLNAPIKIWPVIPKSDREFWNYVALEAKRRSVPVPEFMEGVTQLTQAEKKFEAVKRAGLVERWKRALGQAHLRENEAAPAIARTIDL